MNRFYIHTELVDQTEIILPEEESKHASKVLRLKEGDQIEVCNGKGTLSVCTITKNHPKKTSLLIEQTIFEEPDEYYIHIAIAPTKNIARFEWFLEKSTELGIHRISPIIAQNSERKVLKTDRLEKIIVAAMKQSKRLYLPTLDPLLSFDDFISSHSNGCIAHCVETEKNSASTIIAAKNCPILIGPEGDFSDKEIEKALQIGYKPLTLGKTRLRTETAGVYACMLTKNLFE